MIINSFSFLLVIFSVFGHSQQNSVIPDKSKQLVIMITENVSSSKGKLYYFEKNTAWKKVDGPVPVVLAKNGLGWGRGLGNLSHEDFPVKKEGDNRSPAGIFKLGAVFGFAPVEAMKNLKMPYIHITDMLECIDDLKSSHYNQIVYRDSVDKVDWNSSEEMKKYGKWYEQGVIIEHNVNPEVKGAGSCIFIHNWASSDETTSGCTEMQPEELTKLLFWLDKEKNPVLVQMTIELYEKYRNEWGMPEFK